ncbi:MAG TPA: hypothetical protein DCL66_05050 [Gammaproteobacteria bacterium]|nr:hypothetical protein [Gammaproteobacteria bacterium]
MSQLKQRIKFYHRSVFSISPVSPSIDALASVFIIGLKSPKKIIMAICKAGLYHRIDVDSRLAGKGVRVRYLRVVTMARTVPANSSANVRAT